MAVVKAKPAQTSHTVQQVNRDLVRKYLETTESAKRAIETSKRLTQEARGLIDRVRAKKKDRAES